MPQVCQLPMTIFGREKNILVDSIKAVNVWSCTFENLIGQMPSCENHTSRWAALWRYLQFVDNAQCRCSFISIQRVRDGWRWIFVVWHLVNINLCIFHLGLMTCTKSFACIRPTDHIHACCIYCDTIAYYKKVHLSEVPYLAVQDSYMVVVQIPDFHIASYSVMNIW